MMPSASFLAELHGSRLQDVRQITSPVFSVLDRFLGLAQRIRLLSAQLGVVQNLPILGHTGARRAPAYEGRMSTFDVPGVGGGQPPPALSPPGLKRSQAEQGEPVRMVLAGHQLPRA